MAALCHLCESRCNQLNTFDYLNSILHVLTFFLFKKIFFSSYFSICYLFTLLFCLLFCDFSHHSDNVWLIDNGWIHKLLPNVEHKMKIVLSLFVLVFCCCCYWCIALCEETLHIGLWCCYCCIYGFRLERMKKNAQQPYTTVYIRLRNEYAHFERFYSFSIFMFFFSFVFCFVRKYHLKV